MTRFRTFICTLSVSLATSTAHRVASGENHPSTFTERIDAQISGTGLTSYEVARRAVASSPDVDVRRQELLQAAAEVDEALAAYLPTVTVKGTYKRLSNVENPSIGNIVGAPGAPAGPIAPGTELVNVPIEFANLSNQYAIEASLLVPVSDYFFRIAPAKAAAEANRGSRAERLAATALQVAADARLAYYTWARARLSMVVAEQSVELSKAHLADVEQAFAAGTASRADVLRVESQLANSEQYLLSSRTMSAIAEERVRIISRARPSEEFRIGEDLRKLPAAPRETERELVAEAYSARPEFKALDHAYRAETKRAKVEHAGILPRFQLLAGAQYSNPNPRIVPQQDEFRTTWEVGAQLGWTLSDIPKSLARTDGANARAQALRAERRALADRVRDEVVSARRTLEEEVSSVNTADRGLAAAEESYRVRRLLFQSGKATNVELLDAEAELIRARLEALNARVDSRVAAVRLDYALGRRVERTPRRLE